MFILYEEKVGGFFLLACFFNILSEVTSLAPLIFLPRPYIL